MIKKNNRGTPPNRARLVVALAIVLGVFAAVAVGLSIVFGRLRSVWNEQYVVTDHELDVVITSSGKRVVPETIAYKFGLTNGANLAEMPFERMRAELLEQFPLIRDVRIERRLPRRVNIDVFEREPIARVVNKSTPREMRRVVDADGVVFNTRVGVDSLPVIYEAANAPPVPAGKRLSGLASAALTLVEVVSAELSQSEGTTRADLRVRMIDASREDYLLVTLASLDQIKIAWAGMLERTKASQESLRRQFRHVAGAIASELRPHPTLWLATDWSKPGRITATSISRSGDRQ